MRKKLLSLLLAFGMIATMFTMTASAEDESHFTLEVSKEGNTITATLSTVALSNVISVTGGFRFDATKLTCTSVKNCDGYEIDGIETAMLIPVSGRYPTTGTAASTVAEANANAHVGFAFAGTAEKSYQAGVIVSATFTIKEGATGDAVFTVYESADGSGGLSPSGAKDTSTKTIEVAPEVVPTVEPTVEPTTEPQESINIALASNGGTAFASSGRTSAKIEHINDGTYSNVWQTNATSGEAYGGVTWTTKQKFKDIILYWASVGTVSTVDAYSIQIQNDSGEWVTVSATKSREDLGNVADMGGKTWKDTVTLANVAETKGVRLYVANMSERIQFREFEVYNYVGGVEPTVEPQTNANLALVENGGTAFANSAKGSAPISGLNDTTNVRWQPSETASGAEVYAGILWAEAKTIDKLIFMWRDVQYAPAIDGTDYLIQYSNDTTTGKDGTWTSIGNVEKVRLGKGAYADIIGDRLTNSNDDITQKNCAVDTVSFEPITVKAIRILMKIPEGKNQIQLFEMEVYAPASFTVQEELIAKAASGKENLVDKFELTSIDKASFGENDIVKVDYTITRGEKTESGTRYIESAWKGIKLTLDGVPTEITAASLGGAKGEYLTGIIFRNLKETDVVEVTYSIVAAPEE